MSVGFATIGVSSAGGMIISGGSTNVFVNGAPMAVVGSVVAPHKHGDKMKSSIIISSPCSTVFVNGKHAAVEGAKASCGHSVTACSPNTGTS